VQIEARRKGPKLLSKPAPSWVEVGERQVEVDFGKAGKALAAIQIAWHKNRH
jgi:hypothetical protein